MQFPLKFSAPLLAGLLFVAGCSVPHVMGLGSYYAVTDDATGRVYYTDKLSREGRDTVEFADRATGAWVSLKAAQVQEISKSEFLAGPPQ
ncbi:MAG: hypothetical protein ABIX37_11120 [Gammaproteobacteria bacterium]